MLKVFNKSTTDICENGINIELVLEDVEPQTLFKNDEAHNSVVDLASGLKEVADIEKINIQLEALKEQCDTRAFGPIFNSICSLDSQTYYDIICIIGFILRKLEVKKRIEFIQKIKNITDIEQYGATSFRNVAPAESIEDNTVEAEAEVIEERVETVEAEADVIEDNGNVPATKYEDDGNEAAPRDVAMPRPNKKNNK